MIELHSWKTPNGHKVTLFLEEAGLPYKIFPIDISKDAQFAPDFLKISPNNRIPAILDRAPADGGEPVALFESGAILTYLGEKTGLFLPNDIRGRAETLQWLFWQVGGVGPMMGQANHFSFAAPEKIAYGIERYRKESERLFGVLDKRLNDREFAAGDYSIADMALYPWVRIYERLEIDISAFPRLKGWLDRIGDRPATQRVYDNVDAQYGG